jgi:GNAT superfamily N-acetyltransferase
MTTNQLHIRLARPDDRAAVVEMVATVWDGTDYLPKVWDEWLADPGGPLLIAELAQRPVVVAKLSALGGGEDWFEGLRVAPEQRGKGFARIMLQRCVELSRERRAHVLRYLTGGENLAMQRIALDLGFQLIYAPVWYRATPLADGPAISVVPPDRLPTLLSDIARSPLLAQTGRLYAYDWCTFELTEERLRAHVARGEVWALADADAWAIVAPNQRRGVWLAHIEAADSAGIAQLGSAIRAQLEPTEEVYVRALLPSTAPQVRALSVAGFIDEGHQMHIYELRREPPVR